MSVARIAPSGRGVRISFDRKRTAKAPQIERRSPVEESVSIPLELEVRSGGTEALVRASNDLVRDTYGTVITVEGLHEWAEGYLLHRTVNLQHDLDLRGIKGRPFIGVATHLDFTPQLEISVRVVDPEAQTMLKDGILRGASLEFIPLRSGMEARTIGNKPAIFYHRLSKEPETTGLALTDRPSVPGADLLALRSQRSSMAPNWAFAVVDPSVLNGQVTDPEKIERLRWLPHHDLKTRFVDESLALRSWRSLEAGAYEVPEYATLSREEVRSRAEGHFYRHFVSKVGLPGIGYKREG